MGRKLVVVESPAKAKTINRYLGKGYVVKATMGHVRDLPPKEFGVDIEADFKPTYVTIRGKGKVLQELRKAAKDADMVYLAVDMDREGEAIAWHVKEALKLPDKKVKRVLFNEITKGAISEAFANPLEINKNRFEAQQARRVLDRLVGYKMSPLLWKKVTKGLSAGRVQSVAVRIIVEREREIREFVSEEFWRVTAELSPQDRAGKFSAEVTKCDGRQFRPGSKEETDAAISELKDAAFVVSDAEVKTQIETPPPPFITSTLQQAASSRLRFSTKRTMHLAQQLYEGVDVGGQSLGLITYMRTDSTHLSETFLKKARQHVQAEFGKDYVPEKTRRYRPRKSAQAAHEAIRPTDVELTPESVKPFLHGDLFKLYSLIWRRAVACQMAAARFAVSSASISAGRYTLNAKGRKLLFDGFRRLAKPASEDEMTELPPLNAGERLKLEKLEPSQHFTQPPPRYTEATLVRELERRGIGRPSTYAPIISTIQERGYVKLKSRAFHATELGELVTEKLVDHFREIVDVDFTRNIEDELDRVEDGSENWVDLLRRFYEKFSKRLEEAYENMTKAAIKTGENCPECGEPLVERWSKQGKFIGCSGFPKCRYTRGDETEEAPEDLGKCPDCGGELRVRRGRFGAFVACTKYPECKYSRNLGKSTPPEKTGKPCPKCGAELLIRTGKRGKFIACSAYPKCRHAEPIATDVPCPQPDCDGKLISRGRGRKRFYGCTNYPECEYTTSKLPETKEQPDGESKA